MLMRFILCGLLGLVGQVVGTALADSVAQRRIALTGRASLALFPLFGCIAFLYPAVAIRLGGIPWYARGLIYCFLFYLVQFVVGIALSRFGWCPWEYAKGRTLGGVVRLADAPLFFGAGLAIEWLWPFVKIAAAAL